MNTIDRTHAKERARVLDEFWTHRIPGEKIVRKFPGPIGEFMLNVGVVGEVCPQFRDGVGIDRIAFTAAYLFLGQFTLAEDSFMNVAENLQVNYEAASALWKKYEGELSSFRSRVKNDVVSLEASARKTTEAVHRMSTQYQQIILQLNSPEMMQAVQNAERLAAAVSALSALQSHHMQFEVIERHGNGSDARNPT